MNQCVLVCKKFSKFLMRKEDNMAENNVFVNVIQFLGSINKNLLTVVASVEVTWRDILVSLCHFCSVYTLYHMHLLFYF